MPAIESERTLASLVKDTLTEISTGDLDGFAKVIGDDIVYELTGAHPLSGAVRGKDNVLAMIRSVRGAFVPEGPAYIVDRVIECGGTVVSIFRGRGALKNGNAYDNAYCAIWDFEDGKVARITEFFDSHHAVSVFLPSD